MSEPPAPPTRRRRRCPICGRPTDPDYRPFCSRRCADVDLARWLSDGYRIPDEADTADEGAEEAGLPGSAGQDAGG
jgi:endogenous inhibitor of DNA gyrase (YacG/DUF329 family)